jgi:hypothetical protein
MTATIPAPRAESPPAAAPPSPPADRYGPARYAAAVLAQRPRDPVALGNAVATLAQLHLGAAARRTIDTFTKRNPGTEKLADLLIPLLDNIPAGLVTWASRRRRFEANLQSLAARDPILAQSIAAAWTQAEPHLQLHTTIDRNPEILELSPDGSADRWWGALANHHSAATGCKLEIPADRLVPPLMFDGIGLAHSLPDAFAATHHTFHTYSAPIYIVEPQLAALAVTFHLHDLRDQLASPRLRIFAGPSAIDDYTAALRANPRWAVPGIFLTHRFHPRDKVTSLHTIGAAIANERVAAEDQARAATAAYYADKDVHHWSQRFATAAPHTNPLRILGLCSRYTTVLRHTISELGAAITASGHHFTLGIEPDDHSTDAGLPEMIARLKPDLLIIISRLRFEKTDLPENVPCLSWDQDALPVMATAAARESLTPLTYVAGVTPYEMMVRRQWPSANSIYCHLAAATHRYPRIPAPADLRQKYECDFSFVSNASSTPQQMLADAIANCATPQLGDLCNIVGQTILTAGAHQPDDPAITAAINTAAAQHDVALTPTDRTQLLNALRKLADRVLRHTIVRWVAAYATANHKSFKLFGAGWENHPDLAPFACGPIAQGEPLRALYQASRINLQIARWGLLHSRPLDGMAAGGFFLTNHSVNDYDSLGLGDAPFQLCRRALQLNLRTVHDVETSPDPLIQKLWPLLAPVVSPDERVGEFAYLRQCANMPPADFLFPNLRDFTFTSQQDFTPKADYFLTHADARTAIVQRNHTVIETECSYDVRWKLFLTSITTGLQHFAAQHRGNQKKK